MAKVNTKQAETIYTLELTEREANALTELLTKAESDEGEGSILDDVYIALFNAGAESDATSSATNDAGHVVVYRDEDAS